METVEETPSATEAESVTSTAMLKTQIAGNSDARAVMAEREERRVLSRSQMQTPDAPCSSMARAQERPRVPAPPVTGRVGQFVCVCVHLGMNGAFLQCMRSASACCPSCYKQTWSMSNKSMVVSKLQRLPGDVVFQEYSLSSGDDRRCKME